MGDGGAISDVVVWLFLTMGVILGIAVYFFPTIFARFRFKKDILAIFLLNLFFGWSIIGWIICLIWAAKHDIDSPRLNSD